MRGVFGAVLGLAIGFALYAPQTARSCLPLKALGRVDAELAAAHPEIALRSSVADFGAMLAADRLRTERASGLAKPSRE